MARAIDGGDEMDFDPSTADLIERALEQSGRGGGAGDGATTTTTAPTTTIATTTTAPPG